MVRVAFSILYRFNVNFPEKNIQKYADSLFVIYFIYIILVKTVIYNICELVKIIIKNNNNYYYINNILLLLLLSSSIHTRWEKEEAEVEVEEKKYFSSFYSYPTLPVHEYVRNHDSGWVFQRSQRSIENWIQSGQTMRDARALARNWQRK